MDTTTAAAAAVIVRKAQADGMRLTHYFEWVMELAEEEVPMDPREASEFPWLVSEALRRLGDCE